MSWDDDESSQFAFWGCSQQKMSRERAMGSRPSSISMLDGSPKLHDSVLGCWRLDAAFAG